MIQLSTLITVFTFLMRQIFTAISILSFYSTPKSATSVPNG